mgnify:CR=1 FL=1|jgi:hypothetical protein
MKKLLLVLTAISIFACKEAPKDYMTFSGLKVIQENFGLRLLRPEFVGLSAHKIPLRSHKASSERNANMAKYLAEKYPEFV